MQLLMTAPVVDGLDDYDLGTILKLAQNLAVGILPRVPFDRPDPMYDDPCSPFQLFINEYWVQWNLEARKGSDPALCLQSGQVEWDQRFKGHPVRLKAYLARAGWA